MAARGRSWRAASGSVMVMAIMAAAALLLQGAAACGGHGHSRKLKGSAAGHEEAKRAARVGDKGSAVPVLFKELPTSGSGHAQHPLPVRQVDLSLMKETRNVPGAAAGETREADTILRTSVDMSSSKDAEQIALPEAELFRSSAPSATRSCGTRNYDNTERAAREAKFQKDVSRMRTSKAMSQQFTNTTINVHYHVVHDGTTGNLPEPVLMEQIRVMNEAFAPAGFSFKVASINRVKNRAWFRNCHYSDEGVAMMKALRRGTYAELNFFTCTPEGLLGYAQFPEDRPSKETVQEDAVVMLWDTLPGLAEPGRFNLGDTAVHEVGHWLGLYHVFEGGCSEADHGGDYVADTPASKMHMDCKPRKDTCPGMPGKDPIHNYMAYTDDACISEFTPGQIKRMQEQWMAYRAMYIPKNGGGSQKCEDKEVRCTQWAGMGFCGPQYVHPTTGKSIRDAVCRKSCMACDCADVDPLSCSEWASAPEQYCRPGWVDNTTKKSIRDVHCRASCNTCGCLDLDSQCSEWAQQGFCPPEYVLSRNDHRSIGNVVCRKSCGTCGLGPPSTRPIGGMEVA